MADILETGEKNLGKKSIFSEIIILDFYDGPIQAVCKIMSSDDWMISSLVYFDPDARVRIFSLINMPMNWLKKYESYFKLQKKNDFETYEELKKEIRKHSQKYKDKVYLIKCKYLSSEFYEIVQFDSAKLPYFDDVESVIMQTKQDQLKWLKLFNVPD